ncbi:MAG: hypothetical protein WBG32_18325, partial [Nodosilinea sp.]
VQLKLPQSLSDFATAEIVIIWIVERDKNLSPTKPRHPVQRKAKKIKSPSPPRQQTRVYPSYQTTYQALIEITLDQLLNIIGLSLDVIFNPKINR